MRVVVVANCVISERLAGRIVRCPGVPLRLYLNPHPHRPHPNPSHALALPRPVLRKAPVQKFPALITAVTKMKMKMKMRMMNMNANNCAPPSIGLIMGSASDWKTMGRVAETLESLGIRYSKQVVSAHRTPDDLFEYAEKAEERGLTLIIAGAGGAAHLPGMTAAKTIVPVIGVPVIATPLNGVDALLSIMQMPAEVGVATVGIGEWGAVHSALFAARILAREDEELYARLYSRAEHIPKRTTATKSQLKHGVKVTISAEVMRTSKSCSILRNRYPS